MPRRPRIFLANLGLPADFAARANFAKNVFEAGGIEAITNQGFANNDELAAAFKASGAALACLCAADETYAQTGVAAAKALKVAGAAHIYGAGRPGALEADLQRAGVDAFVYSGCDVLAILRDAHRRLDG